jgi:hypothetical protein
MEVIAKPASDENVGKTGEVIAKFEEAAPSRSRF